MQVVACKRHGFTLIEILMVLAILVILFGLLFAPMMASLDMVTTARSRARMQDAMRFAMEQVKRDLSQAMVVFPPESVRLPGTDGNFGTPDDKFIIDYSTIIMAQPARDNSGRVVEPLRLPFELVLDPDGIPGTADDVWMMRAVRYAVHTPKQFKRVLPAGADANLDGVDKYYAISVSPNSDNPFVLYRQEGWVRYNPTSQGYEFGSYAYVAGVPYFVIGLADSENAMSPTDGADFPVTTSVSIASGQSAPGYVDVDAMDEVDPSDDVLDNPPSGWNASGANGDINLVYIHAGVQFSPLEVTGEWLKPSADGVLYRATYGNWLGYQNDGSMTVQAAVSAGLLNSSELAPRLTVRRWSPLPAYSSGVPYDSLKGPAASVTDLGPDTTWESRAGVVRIGHPLWATITVTNPADPVAAGKYYKLGIKDSEMPVSATGRDYSATGVASGAASILTPIYPAAPTGPLDPAMPISFQLDPTAGGAYPQAKIVPESIRVWLEVTYAGANGVIQRIELSPTTNVNQETMGALSPLQTVAGYTWWYGGPLAGAQFGPYLTDVHGTAGEVRFNRYRPPSPQSFGVAPGTLDPTNGLRIRITAMVRHNFDPATYEDDRLVINYRTNRVMNVALKVQRWQDLVDRDESAPTFVMVPEGSGTPVSVHDEVEVQNLTR